MAGKFRGQSKWDPALIVYQILTIQLLCYASLCFLIMLTTIVLGYSPSTSLIFDYKAMRLGSAKAVIFAHLANAFVGGFLLKVFVERSKACLDFSLTYYFIHFVLVCYHSRCVPDTFLWYFINISGALMMCVTAESLCRKEEMKCIPISASV